MAAWHEGLAVNRSKMLEQKDSTTENPRKTQAKKGFDCEVCFVTFTSSHSLKRHTDRYIHPTYPCNKCGIKFSSREILQTHNSFAHDNANLKNFKLKCPVCNQAANMETTLRSHICHYHNDWVHRNLPTFASESRRNETETMKKRTRKLQLIRLIKSVMKTTSEDNGDTTSGNTSDESEDKQETNEESSDGLENREDLKTLWCRNTRSANNNYHISLPDRSELGWNEVNGNQLSSKERSNDAFRRATEAYQKAASLRSLYSLKDCYVPLTRIDSRKIRQVDSESCRKMIGSLEEINHKRLQHQEVEKSKKIKLLDVAVRLEKISSPDVIFESDDYESYDPSSAFGEPLDDCFDPLGSCNSDEDNCDVDESSTGTVDTFAHHPMTFEYPIKTEVVDCGVSVILEARTENCEQNQTTPNNSFKPEPMDCDVDGDSPIRTGSSPTGSELLNVPVKSEPVYYELNQPLGNIIDVPLSCTETVDPLFEVAAQGHTISEYTDHRTENAAKSPGLLQTNPVPFETNSLSESEPVEAPVDLRRTMVSSKLCNKLFSGRRALLRHCREKHLECYENAVFCYCGKEMNGRRAMEQHFSLHCDSVVKTTREASNPASPCKPLEKKYKCAKCGKRFWLETCLKDHPPNCELPKTDGIRRTPNVQNALGEGNEFGDNREYTCRICDIKFTSTGALVRHVSLYSSNDKSSCPYCRTVFPGLRLLKSHIQCTHELSPSTLYIFFCGICNQGFTKRTYQRMHMKHIHPNEVIESTARTTERDRPVDVTSATTNMPETQCNVCNLVFVNKKRYMDHISYYNKNEFFRCNICGKVFEGQYNAHHHRKKVHYVRNLKNAYTQFCVRCKEGFMYKTHLHAHMFHVHKEQFNAVTSVKRDSGLEKKGAPPVQEFTCNRCPKKYRTVALLLAHLDSCHLGPRPGRVKCNKCNEEFSTWAGWIDHLKNYHNTNPNDLLGVQFATKDSPSSTSTGNSIPSGKFSCITDPNAEPPQLPGAKQRKPQKSTTGNIFVGRENLSTVDDVKTPTQCTTCGFDCPGPWGLSRHKATYSNTGIYVCEFCGRRFSWQSFYRDHKLKHFRRDVLNHCFCPICDEGFESPRSLEMHTIHLHQQSLAELKVNTTQKSTQSTCDICNMVFVNSEKLRTHRETFHLLPETYSLSLDGSNKITKVPESRPDKFYVVAGNTVNAHVVHSIGKKAQGSTTAIDLTSNLYRYDGSLTCKVCNLTYVDKDMLNDHHRSVHYPFGWIDPEQRKALQKKALETYRVVTPNQKEPATMTLLGTVAEELETMDGRTSSTSTAKFGQPIHQKVKRYRCSACDIFFTDKSFLAVHEEVVHCLKTLNCDSSNEGTSESRNISTKNPQPHIIDIDIETENESLPTTQSVSQHPQSASNLGTACGSGSPEEILISDDESDDRNKLSSTGKNSSSVSVNKRGPSPPPLRLIKLPPGKYRIAKLKVRSDDTVVRKVMTNIKSRTGIDG